MRAFPFDSRIVGYDADGLPNYDRASNSEEFARLLASFLSDGVFGSGMCAVLEDTGMTASVQTGACLIQGRYGYIITPETVTFDAADAAPRIDTVVLQRHLGADVRNIRTAVHKGVAAASPSAPALTRDNTVWELGLANVLIPANSTAIAQSRITDTRLNTDRCGIVASIMGEVDTSALYAQIQADLAGFKANEQAAFSAWFAGLQTDLSGDVAGNLLNMINTKQEKITSGNAAAVRSALGLKSGALLRVEHGSATITATAGASTTVDVVFDTAFAETPNIYVSMFTSQDPQYFSVCGSSQSESGFTVKVSSTFTATRAINVQWLAIG